MFPSVLSLEKVSIPKVSNLPNFLPNPDKPYVLFLEYTWLYLNPGSFSSMNFLWLGGCSLSVHELSSSISLLSFVENPEVDTNGMTNCFCLMLGSNVVWLMFRLSLTYKFTGWVDKANMF